MEIRELTCIGCPLGSALTVRMEIPAKEGMITPEKKF